MYQIKINQQWKWNIYLDLTSMIYLYAWEALHTSGTNLNYIINLQSTAIEAMIQKLYQVLMVIQPKKLRLGYIL
jgi:hypothetical protein